MIRILILALALHAGTMEHTFGGPIVLTDDAERTVRLMGPATRVVTLEPFLTELVFAAGAGPQLVGVATGSYYPFETFAIPKVRSVDSFIFEQHSTMKPDLVLASIDGLNPDQVERISAMGTSVYVAYARRLDHVPRLLRTIGLLTAKNAEGAAQEYEETINRIRAAHRGKAKFPVFVEIRHRPLTTVSASHFLNDIVDLCGGQNVFATQTAITPEVLWDQVYRRTPRAILGFGSASSMDEFSGNWAVRRQLEAVREGRLLLLDTDVIQHPTTRTPGHVAQVCKLLDTVRP